MLHRVRPPPSRARSSTRGPLAAERPLPTREQLAALDIDPFVERLDRNVSAISRSSLAALVPPDAAHDLYQDPRFAGADALFRTTLRGFLVASSFRDLPDEARVHPAVQARMWSAMDEMDSGVRGLSDTLSSMTAAERAEVGQALRAEPELGNQVLHLLDAEAAKAGVSTERREHLHQLGKQACFRLRQSTSGFIDEYTGKVRKSRPQNLPEAERHLAAQMGEAAFEQERTWQLAVSQEWHTILAEQNSRLASGAPFGSAPESSGFSADEAYAPPAALQPPPPPGGHDPNSGRTVLKVGAILFGIGVFSGVLGGVLVSARNDDFVLAGLFSFTAAALFSAAGLICLIVGAILRARARSIARLQYTA